MLVRAAAVAVLALGLAWLITAATDEGGLSWTERVGRLLPLTPGCAAVGVWVVLAPVRTRGEALALAALGRSRAQVTAAAVAGGALVALAGAATIGLAPGVDATAFFPRAAQESTWVWQDGSFIDRAQGLLVGASGAPLPLPAETYPTATTIPPCGRAAAAIATAIAGLALPLVLAHALLASHPNRSRRAWGLGRGGGDVAAMLASGGAIAASIALFQAAAAGRVAALLGAVPPAALLAFAVQRYRRSP